MLKEALESAAAREEEADAAGVEALYDQLDCTRHKDKTYAAPEELEVADMDDMEEAIEDALALRLCNQQ